MLTRIVLFSALLICAFPSNGQELENSQPVETSPFDPSKDNFTLIGISDKTWEGPYHQEAIIGGLVNLPCFLRPETSDFLLKQRRLAIDSKYFWSILWVHQTWNDVVDPWMGDGRRGYDPLEVIPDLEPNTKVHLEQTRLNILDANPADNGVYACVMAKYPLARGLSPVILSDVNLISIYFLRIQPGMRARMECALFEEQNTFCRTGFESWTQHVYYPSGGQKGDVLFQVECQADVFLTAITMGGIDPTFWSIGWRFVPLNESDDTRTMDMHPDRVMPMTSPVHVCHPAGAVPCVFDEEMDQIDPRVKSNDLEIAQKQASKLWRARWLVLTGTVKQRSGRWQCWVQSLAVPTDSRQNSVPVRWFVNELYVKIIEEDGAFTWWTTVEFWRVLGLIAAPGLFILIGLIMAVGRTAAYLYPEKIPTKKEIKLLGEQSTPTPADANVKYRRKDVDEFDPYTYVLHFLKRQGVDSYHDANRDRLSRLLFR